MVTVLVFGETLRQAVADSAVHCEVAGTTTVKKLLEANQDKLAGVASFMSRGELLVTVNKKVAVLDSVVKDGDTIKLTHQVHPTMDGAMWQNP